VTLTLISGVLKIKYNLIKYLFQMVKNTALIVKNVHMIITNLLLTKQEEPVVLIVPGETYATT
jgi:hypothetical protein